MSNGVSDVPTTVVCQRYSDRILILITQLGKVGCLIEVSPPANLTPDAGPVLRNPQGLPFPHPSSNITRILGVPPDPTGEALQEFYARQAAAIVYSDSQPGTGWNGRGVIVGVALKRSDEEGVDDRVRETFAEVMRMVTECKVW